MSKSKTSRPAPDPRIGQRRLSGWLSDLKSKATYVLVGTLDYAFELGPKAAVLHPEIVRLLPHKNDKVRSAAARALGSLGPAAASAVPELGELLLAARNEKDAGSLAEALVKIGPVSASYLAKGLKSKDPKIKAAIALSMADLGPVGEKAVPTLLKLLKSSPDESPEQYYAAEALGKIAADPARCVPALIKMLDKDDYNMLYGAVQSLGAFGPSAAPAVPRLIPLLSADNWVRFHATEALGKIGPFAADAIGPLRSLLKDKERQVREAADRAIHSISQKPLSATKAELAQKPKPGDNLIDLARTKEVVARMLKEGVARFVREHPDETVGCVALFSGGFGKFACLCIGTPEDAADLTEGGAYDFKFSEYARDDFEWWPNLYEMKDPFQIKLPDGKIVKRSMESRGNEAIDKPLFDVLIAVMRESQPLKGLRRSPGFQVGVEMHDSPHVKFWKADR